MHRVGTTGARTRSPLASVQIRCLNKPGTPGTSRRRVDSASLRVSSSWGAQLSWASLGGHTRTSRVLLLAPLCQRHVALPSQAVSQRISPSGFFSLHRPPGHAGVPLASFSSRLGRSRSDCNCHLASVAASRQLLNIRFRCSPPSSPSAVTEATSRTQRCRGGPPLAQDQSR